MANIRQDCVSIATLRELVAYDPETGKLTWLPRQPEHFTAGKFTAEHCAAKWNSRYAGTPALASVEQAGYGHGDLMGKRYKAHRVAWALHFGYWPEIDIDHEDGDPLNNRPGNMRLATKEQNARNQKRSTANKSGCTGVSWNKLRGKWSAQIKMHGKKHHLGLFRRLPDAVAARKAAERQHGFHPNHGRAA